MDSCIELMINSPITEEQWDILTDTELEHTVKMYFHTKRGKDVEFAKVVHGHWIDMGDFEQCSACKATRLKEFNSFYGKVMWIRTAYCSCCGAKMDEVTV